MKRGLLWLIVLCTASVFLYLAPAPQAHAHLCNDVFAQAHDNLAVKVDIRDGQLRIQDKATFRVYLLNTMDRDIASIGLVVKTDAFNTDVQPSPDWKTYPVLRAVRAGGKKEYFEVTLTRKEGIPDGPQKIGLEIVNGQNASMVFKTFDFAEATFSIDVPQAEEVTVDGKVSKEEWGAGSVCTGFYEYQKIGGYMENRPAAQSCRIRMLHDEKYLYFLVNFPGNLPSGCSDELTVFLSKDTDTPPGKLRIDRSTGKATYENPPSEERDDIPDASPQDSPKPQLLCAADAENNTIEVAVPLETIGVGERKNFCVNFTRTMQTPKGNEKVNYWRGNLYSVEDPVVFGDCSLEE